MTFQPLGGSMQATLDMNGEMYFAGKRLSGLHLSDTALKDFVGNYRSGETDGLAQILLDRGRLILKNGSNPPVEMIAIANDEFNGEGSFVILFHRDAGKVFGFSAFAPAARGIEFSRTH
jgi:hypothetical protein